MFRYHVSNHMSLTIDCNHYPWEITFFDYLGKSLIFSEQSQPILNLPDIENLHFGLKYKLFEKIIPKLHIYYNKCEILTHHDTFQE